MSRFRTALHPDDRAWVESLIDAEIDSSREVAVTRICQAVVAELERLAEAGDRDSVRALAALAQDGLAGLAHARIKLDRSLIRIGHNGAIVSLPSRLGVRAVDDTGRRLRTFQQPLWWELSWDRFFQIVRALEAQRDKLGNEAAALKEIAALRDKYPDTKTPGEACEREGRDPRVFGFELGAA